MYFPTWIILVVISLWISLAAFIWGVLSGQFADQDRARYLPFMAERDNLQPTPPPSGAKIQNFFYLVLLATGVAFFAIALGMALYFRLAG
jgi:cbb3-type cytochrome oxidase maturation protein